MKLQVSEWVGGSRVCVRVLVCVHWSACVSVCVCFNCFCIHLRGSTSPGWLAAPATDPQTSLCR